MPVPENIKVSSVTPTSFTLKWQRPQGMKQTPLSYQISGIDGHEPSCTEKCEANITGLKPCSKYSFTICTKIRRSEGHEDISKAVEEEVHTGESYKGPLNQQTLKSCKACNDSQTGNSGKYHQYCYECVLCKRKRKKNTKQQLFIDNIFVTQLGVGIDRISSISIPLSILLISQFLLSIL